MACSWLDSSGTKTLTRLFLMLNALREAGDKIKALDLGVDGYPVKPFPFPRLYCPETALDNSKKEWRTKGKKDIVKN